MHPLSINITYPPLLPYYFIINTYIPVIILTRTLHGGGAPGRISQSGNRFFFLNPSTFYYAKAF